MAQSANQIANDCRKKTMLIDNFAPHPDAVETHKVEIAASREAVYHALWTTDVGGAPIIKRLIALRSLPEWIVYPKRRHYQPQKVTLYTLIEAGFGQLAEEPGREVVFGITGRFWRPVGNLLPFRQEDFSGPVPPGLARAVWNFSVWELTTGRTLLSTETRVVCGDTASRLKFRAYWLFIRPFSGLIRRVMLNAIRRESENIS
jgi:hypothetical protein